MASVLGLPEPKCEIIIKSIIHILKAYVMPYSKQPKNFKFSNICHFGLIERKSLKGTIVFLNYFGKKLCLYEHSNIDRSLYKNNFGNAEDFGIHYYATWLTNGSRQALICSAMNHIFPHCHSMVTVESAWSTRPGRFEGPFWPLETCTYEPKGQNL